MTDFAEALMAPARRELQRMRASEDAWAALRHEGEGDAERRARVLWALQFDRRPEDLALVRFLAEQEARTGDLTEEVKLAGFLLAEFRRPEDVWLQWRIKRASQDTWCGYDSEYLFAAGVERTVALVRAGDHPDRDEILRLAPESEQDLDDWREETRSWFPADPADEEPVTWLDRAELIGDPGLVRELLDRWAADRPRDRDTLDLLLHHLPGLGAFAEAAAAQRERQAFTRGPIEHAAGFRRLAELERRAGDHVAAWAALRDCAEALRAVSGWTGIGLGHSYVEELFLLAGVADPEVARPAFAEGDRHARTMPGLAPSVSEAAVVAAERLGERSSAEHYRARLDG
ncbi:hypothetical protein [Actinoplanes philippinensis]|uniref:hypothetical protein n=1 Tax=Actinoplanes philippinensis TaxID=35752 RepID=UPI0033E9D5A8